MASKKNDPDLSELSRFEDRKVLEILVEHGDDLSRRRHTLLFFHRYKTDVRPGAAIFDPILPEAVSLGFTVARHNDDTLIIEGMKLVDVENLEALSTWADTIADEAGVNFDGWECAMDSDPDLN